MSRKFIQKRCLVILCSCMVFISIGLLCNAADNQQNIEAELQKRLEAWGKYLDEHPTSSSLTGNKYYRNIIDLGMPALPYLMEKIEKGNWALSGAVGKITKKRFEEYERPKDYAGDSKSYAKVVIQWWPKGRKLTPQHFGQRYSQWKNLKGEGKEDEAKKKSEEIRSLGIAALPVMVEKVKEGEKELIPLISKLTDGQVDPNASPSQCFAWWQDNKEKWLIPFPNNRPTANAGKDQTVACGDVVQLDGSASSDADKDELTYKWTQVAGPPVKLSDEKAVKPTFTAPDVNQPAVLTFQLIINDAADVFKSCPTPNSESEPDTINITVNPKGS